jgi:hypothetical protein
LENAAYSGGIGTILVSFSKDGLISASVSRLTKQALEIAVITGADSCSTLARLPVACLRRRDADGERQPVRVVMLARSRATAMPSAIGRLSRAVMLAADQSSRLRLCACSIAWCRASSGVLGAASR